MGAPGYYILCGRGHVIGYIEDDLYWDDDMFKELDDLEKKKCSICGEDAKYKFGHYGDINDCISVKLAWNSKENRWIIPREIRDAKEYQFNIIRKDGD